MFWRFHLMTSNIDTLLDKPDVTLAEIMDEDDVLQECKAQNRKLIDFLLQHMSQMVNMVTQEPSEDCDEKNKYKYPNIACELLTSDVNDITEALAVEDGLLENVYAFLESEGPLNPLLASFFSKVMGLLIARKSDVMVQFLMGKDNFVSQLLHHLNTSAIMDLLLRLITCIDYPECRTTCINWLNEQQLVQKLVAQIDVAQSEEKHCNASQSLCDIVRLSREQMSQLQDKVESDPLLSAIESQETVSSLLDHMFTGEKNESVIVNGLAVIQALLEFRKIGPEGAQEQLTDLDEERLRQGVSSTVHAITPRLSDFHQVLKDPPRQHYQRMPTTAGVLDPPLGNARLQTVRLIHSLLLTNSHAVNGQIASLGTIDVILDLYFKYCLNNFLHTQVEQCISVILSSCQLSEDGTKLENPLLSQLFTGCKLTERILEAWEENEQNQSKQVGHRKGYMGHLTRIANHILENCDKENNMERKKKKVPTATLR